MATGDRIPKELIAPSLLSTSFFAKFTNVAGTRTQMPGLILCNTSTSARTVNIHKNGVTVGYSLLTGIVLEPKTSVMIEFPAPLVFTGTQELFVNQSDGTDVTIAAYGIVEEL